jgi:hypothetical protein
MPLCSDGEEGGGVAEDGEGGGELGWCCGGERGTDFKERRKRSGRRERRKDGKTNEKGKHEGS